MTAAKPATPRTPIRDPRRAAPASCPPPRGFSLLELMVTIGVLAVLALIAYPLLASHISSSRVRAEARTVDSVMQRARMMAAVTQRPVRVILNCTRNVAPECVLNLQAAVYTGAAVTGWENVAGWRQALNEKVLVTPDGASFDGEGTFPGIHWAIFMPDSRVYSDPKPFSLFFHHEGRSGPDTPGWRLTLSRDSGRVTTRRDEADLPS